MTSADNPISKTHFFTIESPAASDAPIKIHAAVHQPPTPVLPPIDDGSTATPNRSTDRPSDPTIIALHYWGGSASTFHHVPALLQRSHDSRWRSSQRSCPTVISISHRGWGLSSPASPDIASAYSISALASDVVALLPQFVARGLVPNNGFVLCGHSMGAKVTMAVDKLLRASASSHLPPLRGMLLLAPAPPSPLILPKEMQEQQSRAYESYESAEWTVKEVLTENRGAGLYGGKGDMGMIVRDSLAGSEGAKKGWPEVGMTEDVILAGANVNPTTDVPGVGKGWGVMRVRVLASRGDKVETAERVESQTVQTLHSNGYTLKFRVLEAHGRDTDAKPNCGHLLPLEAPEAVVEELVGLLDDIDTL